MNEAVAPDRPSIDERVYFDRIRPLVSSYATANEVVRVAVVGNQPLDASAERAAVIDSADIVFRVNGFRLDDDDSGPAVGRRADVVVFNRGVRPTPWFFQGYRERLYLLIEPGRMHWENPSIPAFWPSDLGFLTVSNREVILPLNAAMGMDARISHEWATTGMTMLWLAARIFPNATLDVAGLSFVDNPDQAEWRHAYGDSSPVGSEHRITNEGELVRDWIASGRVVFHR